MRNGKRVMSGLLVLLCLVSFCVTGSATNSVIINGLEYKLSNPKNYTDLKMVKAQARSLYEALADHPEVPSYVYLINSSRTVNVKEDVTAVPAVYKAIEENFTKSTTDYLHLDSLDMVEMVMDLEEELGIDLGMEGDLQIETIGDLADFIEDKLE